MVYMVTGQDPSIVKWLLDIGADFHRRCYGNFVVSAKFEIVFPNLYLTFLTLYLAFVIYRQLLHV